MRAICLIIMLSLFPVQAFAGDVAAHFKNADGTTMTISARDTKHVRMDASPDAYTLLNGNKIYMISRDDDGTWNAMDMDQMAGMMGMMGGSTEDASSYKAEYIDTGRTERIAGYKGKVYELEVTDNGKLVSRDEVVLSTHGDIKRINESYMAIAKQMSSIMTPDMTKAFDDASSHGYGGMLRYGDDMVLQRLDKGPLGDNYFELPSNTQQVQVQAPPQQNGGSVIEQDAKDVGDAAHDEAKQSTIEEVREGVRGMFDSIFD